MKGMRMLCVSLLVVVASVVVVHVHALNNGEGRTPAMGWNSWNKFGCGINEQLIRGTADALVSTGLAQLGYKYLNLDDCWQTSRDGSQKIVADPKAFPSGMKALADYVHSKGLKFGVYSDAGYKTCAGRPGSLKYEKIDAQTYASWGVDYLKYDNCNTDGSSPKVRYPVMRDALNATGRHILFSMCEWGVEDPATWGANVGNSWRTTGDISDKWSSMLSNVQTNDKWWTYAGPGAFNDPDMLEVGNGGMNYNEYQAHFSLWCLVKSPLLIGCDVRSMSSSTLSILRNTEAIAINQDPLGVQGHRVWANGKKEVWAGKLANGDVAVILLNTDTAATSITANWGDIGLATGTTASARDLWSNSTIGSFTGSLSAQVQPHGVRFFRLSPGGTPTANTCGVVGEYNTLSLNCAANQRIAKVNFASYGQPQGQCPSLSKGNCHSSSSQSAVESACLNKNSCSVAASNSVFGDPCSGIIKTLAVAVTCA